jgi:GT2 family glycosyltransferase
MINPDAMLLTPHDLSRTKAFLERHPEMGLAGTRIINLMSELQNTAYLHYPRQQETSANFSHLPGRIASVLGASMIMKRELFEAVQGFDEDYFLYGEETDLCLRIRKYGYQIGYCDEVTVRHIGSGSEKGTPPEEILRKKKMGKLLFYRKHYPMKDVRRIIKNDLHHARWHLFKLSLIRKIIGLTQKQEIRCRRLAIARDLAHDFLKNS